MIFLAYQYFENHVYRLISSQTNKVIFLFTNRKSVIIMILQHYNTKSMDIMQIQIDSTPLTKSNGVHSSSKSNLKKILVSCACYKGDFGLFNWP